VGSFAVAQRKPGRLLCDGQILTINPTQMWVEAVLIRGNRIAAVGTKEAIVAAS